MPVQDNDEKRTAEQPVVDAEEELRRKQAQAQEQQQDETNTQKSGKLLPFLNAKAEHHQSRIDSLDEKIANQTTRSTATRRKSKPCLQRLTSSKIRTVCSKRLSEICRVSA